MMRRLRTTSSVGVMTEADLQPKWRERCRTFHPWSPPFDEQAFVDREAQELADEIDAEILGELLNEHALRKTNP